MASIHVQHNRLSTTYRVLWRDDGKQRSLSFADKQSAREFQRNLDNYGVDEAVRLLNIVEEGRRERTVTEWLGEYVDHMTGIEKGTSDRYRDYIAAYVAPAFGEMPLSAVTDHVIAKWVQGLAEDQRVIKGKLKPLEGKTIKNIHAFVSSGFNAAIKQRLIAANPCQGQRLPRTRAKETTFLTDGEFDLIHDNIPHQHWKDLATWLVLTGMRFSEAAALTPDDIDPVACTCRINKAWKHAGTRADLRIGPPKTRKSNRIISIPQAALDVLDLSKPEWLFTNGAGNPVRAQEFYNGGWKPGREKARQQGLRKIPRVHDLRHTCASWLIQAGVPLPVIQAHLGHESITTTVNRYGHVDRRSHDAAAAALDDVFGRRPRRIESSRGVGE